LRYDPLARTRADTERLVVAGDSAGGNLAAVVALLARDQAGPRIAYQVLIYPVTDHAFDTPSYIENADGYLLTRESMRWFWDKYLASPAAGHMPHVEQLERVSSLIDAFLAE
jgi:acetyl esterase